MAKHFSPDFVAKKSNYHGDQEYCIRCVEHKADAVVGDEVRFDRSQYDGDSRKTAKFSGFERVTGKIIRESYGERTQKHFFSLSLPDGSTTRIESHNLYANGLWRKKWANEADRGVALDETHELSMAALAAQQARLERNHAYRC
jgi:hypothetical protein